MVRVRSYASGPRGQEPAMRNAVILATMVAVAGAADARSVTDSAGRTVTIPETVQRVYAAGPPAAVLLYVLAPDRLIGWPRALSREDERYLPEAYRGLPETGRLTGRGNTANLEVVLRAKPDLIFDFGAVRGAHISLADRLQAQTGIPYLLIDGRFEHTATALRLMGDVLGVSDRAEQLGFTREVAGELGYLNGEEAVAVLEIDADGPAASKGIRQFDIITEIDRERVVSAENLDRKSVV